MRLFGEQHITKIFKANEQRTLRMIDGLDDGTLLNEKKSEIVADIYSSIKEKAIKIDFANKKTVIKMSERLGSSFPPGTDVERNKMYPVAEVTYIFKNNLTANEFLDAIPSRAVLKSPVSAHVDGDFNLQMSYLTKYARIDLSDEVKKEVKDWIINLIPQLETTVSLINEEIDNYNKKMESLIDELISKRIEDAKSKKDLGDDLVDF